MPGCCSTWRASWADWMKQRFLSCEYENFPCRSNRYWGRKESRNGRKCSTNDIAWRPNMCVDSFQDPCHPCRIPISILFNILAFVRFVVDTIYVTCFTTENPPWKNRTQSMIWSNCACKTRSSSSTRPARAYQSIINTSPIENLQQHNTNTTHKMMIIHITHVSSFTFELTKKYVSTW